MKHQLCVVRQDLPHIVVSINSTKIKLLIFLIPKTELAFCIGNCNLSFKSSMNFLSHYYFDRAINNPYAVFGMLLPDLIRNADKTWIIHPEKHKERFSINVNQESILRGWKRHLEVDRLFHDSDFFKHHQHQIKLTIRECITGSPVKPFFLGHISLELLLDNLLISEGLVSINNLYIHLDKIDDDEIDLFLSLNGITDRQRFHNFFENFKKEKYLYSYADVDKITYALKQICKRLWPHPFTSEQEKALTLHLTAYKRKLSTDFIAIFDQIDGLIN